MNKTITFSVNAKGINKAIRELERYKKQLNNRLFKLIDAMCKNGEKYACEYMTHYDTGETLDSIIGYRNGNVGIVEAGGNAIWIEFGTGTMHNSTGVDHFHPNRGSGDLAKIVPWGTFIAPYPENRSGRAHGADPGGWWYYDDKYKLHHTEGIPEEPFMANTAERLRNEFNKTAKGVFK